MGNLFSVDQACKYAGLESVITNDKNVILNSDGVILPGVGAFASCMNNLNKLDLILPLKDYISTGKPFLGICLGMQLLFTESEEFGTHKGMNVFEGNVRKFPEFTTREKKLKVPCIGWNNIYEKEESWKRTILNDIHTNECMYFVHSYYVNPVNEKDILSLTNYEGVEFCSGIRKDNITAFQFHPEKSGEEGLKIYKNWHFEISKSKVIN